MFEFKPSFIPRDIVVVGCGGTGSRLVPMLVQFLRSVTREYSPTGWLPNFNIFLVDGDEVEHKNLARQNFIEADVGKNKALVLANRYSRAFGVNITPVPYYVPEFGKSPKDFSSEKYLAGGDPASFRKALNNLSPTGNIIISCVDSPSARRAIVGRLVLGAHPSTREPRPTFFIDAGNEDTFGQVSFSTGNIIFKEGNIKQTLPERCFETVPTRRMYLDLLKYAFMKDEGSSRSCADLDQTLAINAMMATGILGFVQQFIFMKGMTYNEIRFDLNTGVSDVKNTLDNLQNRAAHIGFINEYTEDPSSDLEILEFLRIARSNWSGPYDIFEEIADTYVRRQQNAYDSVFGAESLTATNPTVEVDSPTETEISLAPTVGSDAATLGEILRNAPVIEANEEEEEEDETPF